MKCMIFDNHSFSQRKQRNGTNNVIKNFTDLKKDDVDPQTWISTFLEIPSLYLFAWGKKVESEARFDSTKTIPDYLEVTSYLTRKTARYYHQSIKFLLKSKTSRKKEKEVG
ncbi:hypothetical protein TNCT_687411 [Trichonephila clavata]|uniref:Uncharacterized protein n=1 Tax=Trichonephila clavata TaxID=2740835 RepID=A0A8X6IAM9_TRICU|nr:hypothetical protein TNCT_687411 [Trichonephila clavata]